MATAATLHLLLYLFWISLLFLSGSLQLCIDEERKALLNVRSGFPDVDGWLSPWKGNDCCSWQRVGCNDISGHVIKLDPSDIYSVLSPTALHGNKVHPSLFHLKHLEYLDISMNSLNGYQIPSEIGSLTKLQHLDLSMCDFEGEIPHQLGNLSSLRYLSLFHNKISGQIPASFIQLRNLQFLDLSSNSISGKIPENIGNLSNIQSLLLSRNQIKGVIPKSIGNLSKMSRLDLSHNGIVGGVPDSITNLLKLEDLSISLNNISGSIPDTLGSLCNLSSIDLHANHITGGLVEFFEQLSRCRTNKPLSLDNMHNNQFRLIQLDLGSNQFSGKVPASMGKLSALEVLRLSSNYLVGDITEAHFANLTNLDTMDISNNNLSVKVSQVWLPPFRASEILMHSCNLGPRFPPWLWNQTTLQNLDISNSGISDAFPDWFWSLCLLDMELNVSLSILNLSYNNLIGKIPTGSQLWTFTNLSYIGNFELCGEPLQTKCPGDNPTIDNGIIEEEGIHEDDEYGGIWYFIGFAPGFVIGFWGFMGAVMIKKSIRIKYILLIDRIIGWFMHQ